MVHLKARIARSAFQDVANAKPMKQINGLAAECKSCVDLLAKKIEDFVEWRAKGYQPSQSYQICGLEIRRLLRSAGVVEHFIDGVIGDYNAKGMTCDQHAIKGP